MTKHNWSDFTLPEPLHNPALEKVKDYYRELINTHNRRLERVLAERLGTSHTSLRVDALNGLYVGKLRSNEYACGKTEWLYEDKVILTGWEPTFEVVMDEVQFTEGRIL